MTGIFEKNSCANLTRIIFWALMLPLACYQSLSTTMETLPLDATCYLDAAEAIRQFRWTDALSSYWSPGYPFAIALVMWATNPASTAYFKVLNETNILVILFSLVCLEFFIDALMTLIEEDGMPPLMLRLNCYIAYAWCFLTLGGLHLHTPDILFGSLVCLAIAFVVRCRSSNADASLRSYAGVGVALGLAILTKAFGSVLLPILAFFMWRGPGAGITRLRGLLLSLAICVVLVAPAALALKLSGRSVNFASTMLLNYHWQIEMSDEPSIVYESVDSSHLPKASNNLRDHHQAEPPPISNEPNTIALRNPFGTTKIKSMLDTGILSHPPDKVSDRAQIFYFGRPVPGTFPIWFDVGYWQDGIKIAFAPISSLTVFLIDWGYYCTYFLSFTVACILATPFVTRSFCFNRKSLKSTGILWTVPLASMLFYSLDSNVVNVHPISQRYFGAFVFILYSGLFTAMRFPNGVRKRLAISVITAINLIFAGWSISRISGSTAEQFRKDLDRSYRIAQSLNAAGLNHGAQIVLTAPSTSSPDITWARLAGLKITAQILNPSEFWRENPKERRAIIEKLKGRGIKAIVEDKQSKILVTPPFSLPGEPQDNSAADFDALRKTDPGWQEVPDTSLFYYKL